MPSRGESSFYGDSRANFEDDSMKNEGDNDSLASQLCYVAMRYEMKKDQENAR